MDFFHASKIFLIFLKVKHAQGAVLSVFRLCFIRFLPSARFMLSKAGTYENTLFNPDVDPADVARGEEPDPEAGTAESGSKGEDAAKSAV